MRALCKLLNDLMILKLMKLERSMTLMGIIYERTIIDNSSGILMIFEMRQSYFAQTDY